MKAVRVHRFGGPEVIACEDIARPVPAADEVLVRIEAAGVGPWDGWIRAGRSALPQPLPLTLGSDFCGMVEEVGREVTGVGVNAHVYGVTNPQFTGAYADFAVAKAAMLAEKPKRLDSVASASLPVIAATAWQMLFDYAKIRPRQRVLILGASGNVGSLAVQLAHRHGAYVIAATAFDDAARLSDLGADEVLDLRGGAGIPGLPPVDAVIDAAGGDPQRQAIQRLNRGGYIVSSVSAPGRSLLDGQGVSGTFFLVNTTTPLLRQIANVVDEGKLAVRVGTVLPLSEARLAHQMLDGSKPYAHGKIVLTIDRNLA
jgi:NADPH:quinone reductase-like Zn-dependent oxidoreductase